MKQTMDRATTTTDQSAQTIIDKKVGDLMVNKRRLVEVPYTASLGDTMNTLVANKILAVPVAAPPGHWIGAGGSMIMEVDKQTGTVRKHYIGLATILDILAHIAGIEDQLMDDGVHGGFDLDQKMAKPVSSIIGQCIEGLSLWTLHPNTSIIDCMEVFSKGIHRALVPVDSHMDNIASGVELVESASSYRMLTQTDVLKFVKEHASSSSELDNILSRTVTELGGITERVYAITDRTKVMDAIKCMRIALLNAVPIVRFSGVKKEDQKQLVNGRGRQVIGTFSATDLRGRHLETLQAWLSTSALKYTELVSANPLLAAANADHGPTSRELVPCQADSTLAEVIDKVLSKNVHRLWVVDEQGLLTGLISLTDLIRVLRFAITVCTKPL